MNTPVAATLRGRQAVAEVTSLLQQLCTVEIDLEEVQTPQQLGDAYKISGCELQVPLLGEEIRDVLHRRRAAILLQLENKGLRIAPDPEATKPA